METKIGKLIVFEGVEGVGKSTQIKLLKNYLTETDQIKNFVFVREPGNTLISEKIRSLLLDKSNGTMTAECEALLYAASRSQLVGEVILPALRQGKNVICDRYYHSSIAYQGFGRGLGEDYIASINSYAITHCRPDMVLFLDLSPAEGFGRKGGADRNDRIESASMDFFNRVYQGFLTMAKAESDIFAMIDCRGAIQRTHDNIIAKIKDTGIIK